MFRYFVNTVLLLVIFSSNAIAQTDPQSLGSIVNKSETAPSPVEAITEESESQDAVMTTIDDMTLDQKIAQIFIIPLQGGLSPSSNDRQFLEAYPPGGIILRDVTKPLHAITLINEIRKTKKSHGIPLLIGTNVFAYSEKERALNDLFLRIPSMTAISAANHDDATQELFNLLAEDLSLMGFDFHLGPDLHLASELDPSRSLDNFGSDPKRIAELGLILGNALNQHNVLWVPAGFPGGSGNKKKENNPAVLLTPRNQLFDSDLWPYNQAIREDLKIIHVGNTLVPTLEQTNISASQSDHVMKILLRQGLNFDGLVLAGPMDALEISATLPPAQAIMRSLANGADMILLNEQGVKALKTIAQVSIAIQNGEFDESLIDNAVKRILQLKIDIGLNEKELPESKMAVRIMARGDKSNAAYTIDRSSITLLRNNAGILPLDKKLSHPVVLTGVEGTKELQEALEEHFKKVFRQDIVSAKHATRIQDFEFKRVLDLTRGAENVIYILTNAADMTTQYQLLQQIKAQNKKLIVVTLDYPENPRVLEPADAIVLAYRSNHSLQETATAISDVLMGDAPVQILSALETLRGSIEREIQFNVHDVIRSPFGRLPIHLSDTFPAGHSISYTPTLALKKVNWEFGDGKGASESVTSHTYKEPGHYTVTLTIKSKNHEPVVGTFPIVIE